MLQLLILLSILSGVVAIISFILYGRARMQEKSSREKMFLNLHYGSLFFLFLLGIIYMFFMVETAT
jgi:hypothetical protein